MTLMTVDALHGIGICSSNINTFKSLFPETDDRYVDGVEVSREVCEEHARDFDWNYAVDYMLNKAGQQEYTRRLRGNDADEAIKKLDAEVQQLNEAYRQGVVAWRDQHGQESDYPEWDTSDVARQAFDALSNKHTQALEKVATRRHRYEAGTFGELFTDPSFHSARIVDSLRTVDTRRDQRQREDLTRAESDLAYNRQELKNAQETIERLTPTIPGKEQQLVKLRVVYYNDVVRRAQRRLEAAAEELEAANRRAEEIRAETGDASDETAETAS